MGGNFVPPFYSSVSGTPPLIRPSAASPSGGRHFPFHQYNTENASCVLQTKYKKVGCANFGTSHNFWCLFGFLPKQLDVVVVGKGNGVVPGGFQRAELLAQLLGLGQHGHIVVGAQLSALASTAAKSASFKYSSAIFGFAPGIW